MCALLDFADSCFETWRDGQPEFGDDVVAVVSVAVGLYSIKRGMRPL